MCWKKTRCPTTNSGIVKKNGPGPAATLPALARFFTPSATTEENLVCSAGGLWPTIATRWHSVRDALAPKVPAGANCELGPSSSGSLVSAGDNLSSEGTCALYFNQSADLNNQNPNLGALANNGGLTFTLLPLLPGAAVDAIPSGVNGCSTTLLIDQRGAPRPIHGRCDI